MYFTNTPALNGMEAIMKKLPYGTQKGGGRFRRLYQYTKKDCDCRLCLYYRKKNGCALALCPVLDIRLGCGAATIGDAIKAVFKDVQNTAFQKRLSQIYHRKDDAEMIFQNNRHKQIFEAERLSIAKESTHHCSDYTAGECAQHTKHYQTGSRLLPSVHQAGRTA